MVFAAPDSHHRTPAHETALACLAAGLEAAAPESAVRRHCELDAAGETLLVEGARYSLAAYDRVVLVGAGKATAGLARALSELLGDRLSDGAIVVESPPSSPIESVRTYVGEHPTPGAGSVAGTARVRELAADADEATLVLAVFSGGGSALLCAPAGELTLTDLVDTTRTLLDAGASIAELNRVRRALSAVKGGRLAAQCEPATVVTVLLSDVVGDDPAVIASGPTVPSSSTPAGALAVLERYEITAPAVLSHLRDGPEQPVTAPSGEEPPTHVIGSGRDALEAAARVARERGYEPCLLSASFEGEARALGRVHAGIATEICASGSPVAPPCVVLSGGECTVTVVGGGEGGPNTEAALGAALALEDGVFAAIDTDGADGGTDVAGAIVDAETVGDPSRAREALAANDATGYLGAAGAALRTGPTGTNVNDLRVVCIGAPRDGV